MHVGRRESQTLIGKGRGERTGAALAARLWDLSETLAISLIFAARVSDLSKDLKIKC